MSTRPPSSASRSVYGRVERGRLQSTKTPAALKIARWTGRVLNEIAHDPPGSGSGRSIAARCYAQLADEDAGHMALVGEAGPYRCLDGCLTVGQELPGQTHAPLHKVGMRRYSYFACEASQELEPAHARQCGQLGQ